MKKQNMIKSTRTKKEQTQRHNKRKENTREKVHNDRYTVRRRQTR